MEPEDRLPELVTFDGAFGGLAEGAAERPMARAGGPDGDDRSGWGCASVEPIAGTVQQGLGAEEGMAVAGAGGDCRSFEFLVSLTRCALRHALRSGPKFQTEA
jgi:hypothetical protein